MGKPWKLTAFISRYINPLINLTSFRNTVIYRRYPPFITHIYSSTTAGPPAPEGSELARVASLIDGCDCGSSTWIPASRSNCSAVYPNPSYGIGEEDAKRSMYSVSTKYYYAFGCRIPEKLTHVVKSLPNVRWVLPDSYYQHSDEKDYGGEPLVNGEVVNYDDKYLEDWLQDRSDDDGCKKNNRLRRSRRKQKTL